MSRYQELGVNIKKPGIEKFRENITNLFPEAFCVIQRDPADPYTGIIFHTDSAGSKPIQAYLHYKESGDPTWLRGIAQDALAMNLNDILCVGAIPISFVDYIALNPLTIDRIELLDALASGFASCIKTLEKERLPILFAGGETADLPDLVRTFDVSVAMFGRGKIKDLITGEKIKPGNIILGLRSGGKVRFEQGVNSGIQSNGLTLARSCLMKPDYLKKYPEISHPSAGRYTGRYSYDDYLDELGTSVGNALLSPTRMYAPIAARVLEKIGSNVYGMIHNTGGGLTKCIRLGKGIRYIKDGLPNPDPIFHLIQRESDVEWKEMYQDFNMGIGYEFIVDRDAVEDVLRICTEYGIGVHVIGRCEESEKDNELIIESPYGKFQYM
jgi:phosphoribosylformylglycinamidine cyclo-ligase